MLAFCMSKYTRNIHVFDQLTDEAAYWLGFLMADGSVAAPTKTRGGVLVFALKDLQAVKGLRAFFESDAPIKKLDNTRAFEGDYTIYRFTLCSTPLVRRLIELGVTPNKTHTAKAPEVLKMNPHFWRGVVDGDGSVVINARGRRVVYLGGASKTLIQQFRDFVKAHVDTRAELSQHAVNKHWRFQVTGKPAEKLCEVLDGTPALKRYK